MNNYRPTIGLEIHAQLKTNTKLFSRSLNQPDITEPNMIVTPIDMGHPGTLPALNYEAVKKVIQVGLAIDGDIAQYTEWDRKNYFYPDIPKAYQISQYKYPLVKNGSIAGFHITRIHLEEDTGKSLHVNDESGEYSLIDYNRAGMPLMELVTEPVIHSAADAARFAKELQLILRYLGAGDANLEKGEMRIEANISVSKTDELGTKVEVKNLNSFRSVERAIEYEINRHIEVLESGGQIIQETRGWDEEKNLTFSQRAKEDAHDYRYFPDPDIPKLYVSEVFDLDQLKADLPEMPAARRATLEKVAIPAQQIEVFVSDNNLYELFSDTLDRVKDEGIVPSKVANFITTNYLGALSSGDVPKESTIAADNLAQIMLLQYHKEISSSGADTLLLEVLKTNKSVGELVEELGLKQTNDMDEITTLAKAIISDFPDQVAEYRAGNENILKFLMGQGMKRSGGKVNPVILTEVIQNEIR